MRKLLFIPTLALLVAAPNAAAVYGDQTNGASGLREKSNDQLVRALEVALPNTPKPEPRPVAVSPALQAIAACESGSDPRAVSSTGQYRGKYQFSRETWAAMGGSGDPAAAPEAEQDRRAAVLYASSGAGQWPVCGQ